MEVRAGAEAGRAWVRWSGTNSMKTITNAKVMVFEKEPVRIKFCKMCGRKIAYSRRSAPEWARIEYCSAACRRMGVVHQRMVASASSQPVALSA